MPQVSRVASGRGSGNRRAQRRAAKKIAQQQGASDLASRPDGSEIHARLVAIEQRADRGDLAGAAADCQALLHEHPELAEAHCTMGVVHQTARAFDKAIACHEKAVALAPRYLEGWVNLAICRREAGQLDEAIEDFRRAVAIRPDHGVVHANLAATFARKHDSESALAHYRSAVRLLPNVADLHFGLAESLRATGRFEEAVAEFEATLALAPKRADLHVLTGSCLRSLGRFDEEREQYRRALEKQPDNVKAMAALAYYALEEDEEERIRARIEQMLARFDLAPNARADLSFALGRIHDRRGDPDSAFDCYRRANGFRRTHHQFVNPKKVVVDPKIDRLVAVFDRSLIERLGAHGDPGRRPVFIVGMPRSGTTLVEQILASHRDVYGAGELPDMTSIVQELESADSPPGPYPECVPALSGEEIAQMSRHYLASLDKHDTEAARVTDKMPQNFLFLGVISILFPNAAVIHCRRDPMDTCVSCFLQNFPQPEHSFTLDLAELGAYYRKYDRLMRHWREALPTPPLEIQYEELVADPEPAVRRMLERCDLEWDDNCLRFHETERPIKTASFWQARQPIYKTSAGKWRHYETHLGPLKDALGDLIGPGVEEF